MERFNVKCPDHYPMPCNLPLTDKEYLLTDEKYKAFFIFQYENQDDWLEKTLQRYFNKRTWRLYNAGREGGTGTKFCKVCRYALASDFGIASLTPLNFNVFQEIGLMQGLQKQILYLLNPNRLLDELKKWELEKLPFDIDDQIYVKHTDEKSLEDGLDKEIPLIIEKVKFLSGFETEFRNNIIKKYDSLSDDARDALKGFLIEGRTAFSAERQELNAWCEEKKIRGDVIQELRKSGFLIITHMSGGSMVLHFEQIPDRYSKILEEIIWR